MRNVISFEQFYESIWLKIPSVWRDADIDQGRPLQLLTLTLAQHFYYSFYLKIASMDELFDVDSCPNKFLPFLASMVSWKLLGTDSTSWRNQIKHAPLLYKIKGTRKAITIAEKLVGYSVFMTELYRDYTGLIVPKEKIFNNFPISVKIKPWFRTTSTDLSKDILNDSFSDILPSYNEGSGTITRLGELLLPRKLRKVSTKSVSLSTTSSYDPLTGSGSLARLAKVSRINVVLKKDSELDSLNSDGTYKDTNLTEAVDLFLQFKPFHILIQDLLVLHSLSDYVLSTKTDTTGEAIISREDIDIYVNVQENDRLSYYNQETNSNIEDDMEVSDTSLFKGAIEIKCNNLNMESAGSINNVSRITGLGFSLSGYARNNDALWMPSDFSYFRTYYPTDENYEAFYEPITERQAGYIVLGCFGKGVTESSLNTGYRDIVGASDNRVRFWCDASGYTERLVDTATGTWFYDSILPEPKYSFKEIPFTDSYTCDLAQLHTDILSKNISDPYSEILDCTIVKSLLGKDSVNIKGTWYSEISDPQASWSLHGISNVLKLHPTLVFTPVQLLRLLFKNKLVIIAKYNNESIVLTNKIHYSYDTKNNSFIFNERAITTTLFQSKEEVGKIVLKCTASGIVGYSTNRVESEIEFSILYPCLIPNESGFSVSSGSRDIQLSNNRLGLSFNRIEYVDNSNIQTEIDTAHITPVLELSEELNELVEDTDRTKLFKTPMTALFTRNGLHSENTGTPYEAISYDFFVSRDTSKWKVYVDPATSEYAGSERVSKTIWANYFNTPFVDSVNIDYDTIDKSGEAQVVNRESFRWQAFKDTISTTHPQYFLSSRANLDNRTSLWTRGSASKIARPYIGSSRDSIQGFRDTNALFNRTENLSDYRISILANYDTDKYKYAINDIDYTDMYKTPVVSFDQLPLPTVETMVTEKTKIIGNKIVYPSFSRLLTPTPQYEAPFDFTHRELYYDKTGNIKPSFFGNNIRTDLHEYTEGLLDDFADPADISIDGLVYDQLLFKIRSDKDTEFLLPNVNTFVSWKEVNTGLSMGTGLFPYKMASTVRPNIQVLRNGIELVYGEYWAIASAPMRILLTSACLIVEDDTIEIIYQALGEVKAITYPANAAGIPYDSLNTIEETKQIQIPLGFTKTDKLQLMPVQFDYDPIISWYRRDTGDFINTSVSTPGLLLTPIPYMYKELAIPNIHILKNGIELEYGTYWKFKSTANSIMYEIVLKQNLTASLEPNDVLHITYIRSIA